MERSPEIRITLGDTDGVDPIETNRILTFSGGGGGGTIEVFSKSTDAANGGGARTSFSDSGPESEADSDSRSDIVGNLKRKKFG